MSVGLFDANGICVKEVFVVADLVGNDGCRVDFDMHSPSYGPVDLRVRNVGRRKASKKATTPSRAWRN